MPGPFGVATVDLCDRRAIRMDCPQYRRRRTAVLGPRGEHAVHVVDAVGEIGSRAADQRTLEAFLARCGGVSAHFLDQTNGFLVPLAQGEGPCCAEQRMRMALEFFRWQTLQPVEQPDMVAFECRSIHALTDQLVGQLILTPGERLVGSELTHAVLRQPARCAPVQALPLAVRPLAQLAEEKLSRSEEHTSELQSP